ncbi:hypothetical protein FLAN108750_11830 [Flavobacterium antarcticum]
MKALIYKCYLVLPIIIIAVYKIKSPLDNMVHLDNKKLD